MTIDVYSAKGSKTGTRDIPAGLLEERANKGLIHQAVLLQQQNAKTPVAHVKRRSEVAGSTKKVYSQKHTGNARRGPIRSPVMRGGGKAWGPRNTRTFARSMPKGMRHAAVRASISMQAKNGTIFGLESYGTEIKTKAAHELLKKLPVDIGRRIIFVLPENNQGLSASVRNIPGVQTILASYLNPRDILLARSLIFVGDALEKAETIFGKKRGELMLKAEDTEEAPKKKMVHKKSTAKATKEKKAAPKKASKKNS